MLHLNAAAHKEPQFDVRWFMFQRRRVLNDADMAASNTINVLKRMQVRPRRE
jgi:hypothetical protein